jgi:hypothetical protein
MLRNLNQRRTEMKEIQTTHYQCEVCGAKYNSKGNALACEAVPVKHDKGVKVGDLVRITAGDGTGSLCKVTSIHIREPGWGPKDYDHTVFVCGDVVDSWGSRQLSFNSYEVLP